MSGSVYGITPAAPESWQRLARLALLGLLLFGATALGGCNTTGTTGQPTARVETRGPAVAFESIDGPPRGVFDRLVKDLDADAKTRPIAVVSRESPAQYRVRGYVSTYVEGKKSAVAWVWDVYDANERRTRRLSGEEPLQGTDPWNALSDDVLRRISNASMTQLTAYLAQTEPASPAAPAPAAEGTTDLAYAPEAE